VPRRRSIRGVLHSFLGSFTSRYSDYQGYWVFGLFVQDLQEMTIDLLGGTEGVTGSGPLATAVGLARVTFRQQVGKAGLDISRIREARLDLMRSPSDTQGWVNGHVRAGYEIRFTARAVSDLNGIYESTTSIFVAPHDPQIELRSTRGAS
jgi:hypothetical protein